MKDEEIINKVMNKVHEDGVASVDFHNEETLDYSEIDIKSYLKDALKIRRLTK